MSPERRELDADNDGVVSDAEIQAAKASSDLLKQDSQRRMAWIAMMSMLVFTALVFLPIFPDSHIKALGDLSAFST